MAHPNYCGEDCSNCEKLCALDKSMPCSPNCDGLNPLTGEPDAEICKTCDAINIS